MQSSILVAILLMVGGAGAASAPDWAYPPLPALSPSADPAALSVPGSARRFTQGQIDSGYEIADWFPDEHPSMPPVVARGGTPPLRACAMCHLPNGNGHPESAGLAGLSVGYLAAQVRAYQLGERTGSRAASMVPIARALADEDMVEAAAYFAALAPTKWTRIVEAERVPETRLGLGAVRYRVPGGGTEELGQRIISVPEDDVLGERRDSHSGFVEYVPPGSVAQGRALVDESLRGTNCATCHGANLSGQGDVPGIAGRLALVMFRGLNDIGNGARRTAGALAMKQAVRAWSEQEMVAIAAYLGTLAPGPMAAPGACPARAGC